MSKLAMKEIQQRALEYLQAHSDGVRFMEIVRHVALLSPETPIGTVSTQVALLPKTMPGLVQRVGRGLFIYYEQGEGDTSHASKLHPASPSDLEKYGFVEIGTWTLTDSSVRLRLNDHGHPLTSLCAYSSDTAVLFVGRTARSVRSKQGRDRNSLSETRHLGRIRASLQRGQRVRVWTFIANESLKYMDLNVDIGAGVEESLVEVLAPVWN